MEIYYGWDGIKGAWINGERWYVRAKDNTVRRDIPWITVQERDPIEYYGESYADCIRWLKQAEEHYAESLIG